MSALGKLSKPVMVMAGLAYLLFLCVALVWWHMPPEVVLALTVGGFALLTISLRPYLGVHAFIMLLFFENLLDLGGGLTGMKVVGSLIIAGWLMSMAARRGARPQFGSLALAMLLFVAWCGVSLMYAYDAAAAEGRIFTFAQLVLVTLMFSSVVDTPARMRGVYGAIVFWTFVSTVIAVVQYYLGMTRAAVGLIGNKNALASLITMAIVCAYLLHQLTANRMARTILASTLPLFFLGLALTFSRAGLIVFLAALVAVWYRVAREKGFLLLLGSASVLAAVTLVLPEAFYQRAGSIVPAIQRQQDTFGFRIRLWKVGMRMVEDRPLVGVGPGNFISAYPRYGRGEMVGISYNSHNAFVGAAAETGLVGLGLFLLLHLLALREARRAFRVGIATQTRELVLLAVAAEVVILTIMLEGMSGNTEILKTPWVFFGLAEALGVMALRHASAERAGASKLGQAALLEGAGAWNVAQSRPR